MGGGVPDYDYQSFPVKTNVYAVKYLRYDEMHGQWFLEERFYPTWADAQGMAVGMRKDVRHYANVSLRDATEEENK